MILDANIADTHSKLILAAGAAISLLLVWALTGMLAEHRQRLALDKALGDLEAAALESGRAKPVRSRFDVSELVESIAGESRGLAEMRGLSLRHRACHVVVETDRVMLERLLRNLVSNALKYTGKGSVKLSCRPTSTSVFIKVADSGPGIPKDKLDLIFEDFYQLENPQRDPRKGLGLGLATVARLARLLDYRLKVYSRMGMGSTFVVEIPRAPGRPPRGPLSRPPLPAGK